VPVLTVVVPAYNAAASIGATLESIGHTAGFAEAIVVDDGSADGMALASTVDRYRYATLLRHDRNLGMCAARNTGIAASRGEYVTILDADDQFAADWLDQFQALIGEWPISMNVSFSACRTDKGEITSADPMFSGLLTLDDLLNERRSGEYLPIFRGEYVRSRGYVDIGTRKSCGILSYIRFAQDAPFWVTPRVLRIYYSGRAGSMSAGWTEPRKARETVECYDELFRRYSKLYANMAPRVAGPVHGRRGAAPRTFRASRRARQRWDCC
jgi:glycosyltransferase involved in cell wall biosynthesis